MRPRRGGNRAGFDVSVVIPAFGRPGETALALRSALAQALPRGRRFEVLLVDDGSPEPLEACLKPLVRSRPGAALRFLRQANAGPAAARNLGAGRARAPLLAFLDSDAQAAPGWLAGGVEAMRLRPEWQVAEGLVLAKGGVEETPFTKKVENPTGGRWLTCNLFVRRPAFLALGGFDARFRDPVREDTEFAFRCLKAGLQVGTIPGARVWHPVQPIRVAHFFRWARDGRFEAFLERTYPRLYRRHLKWIDGRAIPAFHWPYYLGILAAFWYLPEGAALVAAGWAMTLYAWCRRRRTSWRDMARLAWPALAVPYLRLFWVLWGYWKYPRLP